MEGLVRGVIIVVLPTHVTRKPRNKQISSKTDLCKEMSKTFPRKRFGKHFPWFWWRIYRNHKAASFYKKNKQQTNNPKDRGIPFKLSATASPCLFFDRFGSRGVCLLRRLKFLMDQQMKNLQKQQPSKRLERWQWMAGKMAGRMAMVLRLQKQCSPTAKAKKKGDLFKNTEFSQENMWFRTESGDLTRTILYLNIGMIQQYTQNYNYNCRTICEHVFFFGFGRPSFRTRKRPREHWRTPSQNQRLQGLYKNPEKPTAASMIKSICVAVKKIW